MFDISLEAIVQQALRPAMDQLAERDTIQIPSRHGPLSITGKAAATYRSCNSMYWGVPANIPVREMVTVWGRRWIVKESTIPNTGLGLFAVDSVVGFDPPEVEAFSRRARRRIQAIEAATSGTKPRSKTRSDTQGSTCPRKVLRWFPLIPRLLLAYRCASLADLMRWHHENRSDDGIMRTVGDSPAMHHVEATYESYERQS
ncbi:hypothetical protein R1sor_002611 [Riccia sorocarpa]|uniref:Uncharacterized protein n=1 Tax=Riccia sorocarpa TaxID=122646 RepID=A0ABD3H5D3_9MARC